MATFIVNGQQVTTQGKQSLLRFLRDELHLHSVKDGCSEGACGACTVLIDGEPCRACVPSTDRLEGRSILTVEGLSAWEKQVYTYAYGEAGAVQCGFCIPGMVLCSKALLDRDADPTEDAIKTALRNNYCRCTGYVKIIAAVKLAARILREGVIPDGAQDWRIGSRVHRLDVEEKVLGTGKYPDDYESEGMLYGSALRSKYARARIRSIDTSAAKAAAEIKKVEADAEAYELKTRAEAEAEANRKISQSLTQELIAYTYAQRWDGKLPTLMTGDGSLPMLDISDLIRQKSEQQNP